VLKAVATQRPPDGGTVSEVDMRRDAPGTAVSTPGIDREKARQYDAVMDDVTESIAVSSAAGPVS
jgi:hypothetical protein